MKEGQKAPLLSKKYEVKHFIKEKINLQHKKQISFIESVWTEPADDFEVFSRRLKKKQIQTLKPGKWLSATV